MIRTETITIDGNQYMHTWSDEDRKVCRDGEEWDEAIDPLNSGRVYIEGDYIEEEAEATEILDILLGGSDDN